MISDEEADEILASPAGWQIQQMGPPPLGTRPRSASTSRPSSSTRDADELIVVFPSPVTEARLRSVQLLAEAVADL